jgi:pimeloyl-ACP methyl ester carboxylesterase
VGFRAGLVGCPPHAADSASARACAGHSLGGAVAMLCTLRLLRQLEPTERARLRCVCFGAPAVGNAELAAYVADAGWDEHFSAYLLPGKGGPPEWKMQSNGIPQPARAGPPWKGMQKNGIPQPAGWGPTEE